MPGEGPKAAQPLRQFYVAVGTSEAKLATLLDLLRAFEAAAPLSLVVCCGARDSLDAVCSATLSMPQSRVWCLHADMSETELARTAEQYAAACTSWGGGSGAPGAVGEAAAAAEAAAQQQADAADAPQQRRAGAPATPYDGQPQSAEAAQPLIEVLATTDACLRALPKELLPLAPTLLVGYDLPPRKDVYLRRVTGVLGSRARGGQRLAIHFVVAGQAEEFRALEGFAEGRAIEEMPVHVAEILQPPTAAA